MRVGSDGLQLTYCTNIHPAHGWAEVRAAVAETAPALRDRLAPGEPFGLGLRLSDRASRELLADGELAAFQDFLREAGLYVFTLNGFPFGSFHGDPVKAEVHAPDWRHDERVEYTIRLGKILAELLPAGLDGGISTSPLSYRSWVQPVDDATWSLLVANLVQVVAAFARLHAERGALVHLDVEPEADGLLQDAGELVSFFSDHLLPLGAPALARELDVSEDRARELILEHVRVCFDTCHMAVAFEDFPAALDSFAEHGIRMGRLQISSALRVELGQPGPGRDELEAALVPFTSSPYLHQVVERGSDGAIRQWPDLDRALPHLGEATGGEWRIHVHVPIFLESYGRLDSTRSDIATALDLVQKRDLTRHLEIETYTWTVLPPDLKGELVDSMAREYAWVLGVLR